jgi:hypothetical protein
MLFFIPEVNDVYQSLTILQVILLYRSLPVSERDAKKCHNGRIATIASKRPQVLALSYIGVKYLFPDRLHMKLEEQKNRQSGEGI